MNVPEQVAREVRALTLDPAYAPLRAGHRVTPPQLRQHPGPVRIATTVWVHGSGHWRPGVVIRVSTRRDPDNVPVAIYTVAHSTPNSPDRIYVKRVRLENICTRAEVAR